MNGYFFFILEEVLTRFFCGFGVAFMSTSMTCSKLNGCNEIGFAFGMRPPSGARVVHSSLRISSEHVSAAACSALCYHVSEDVRILAVVMAIRKLRQVQRQVGFADIVERVEHAWRSIRKEAGCTDVQIRDLRRTCATWMVAGGENLMVIKEVLHHSSVATTQIYARADQTTVRAALTRHADRVFAVPQLEEGLFP